MNIRRPALPGEELQPGFPIQLGFGNVWTCPHLVTRLHAGFMLEKGRQGQKAMADVIIPISDIRRVEEIQQTNLSVQLLFSTSAGVVQCLSGQMEFTPALI
ncbi:hypothetical protein [Neorhizobium tomejilense]|uniref:hypothetical protein n=1 Tax=Neorhizobium tomejilense TaxID=2093828 RepID=UPI003ED15752